MLNHAPVTVRLSSIVLRVRGHDSCRRRLGSGVPSSVQLLLLQVVLLLLKAMLLLMLMPKAIILLPHGRGQNVVVVGEGHEVIGGREGQKERGGGGNVVGGCGGQQRPRFLLLHRPRGLRGPAKEHDVLLLHVLLLGLEQL